MCSVTATLYLVRGDDERPRQPSTQELGVEMDILHSLLYRLLTEPSANSVHLHVVCTGYLSDFYR